MSSIAVFIPSRLASTRLPNKPLADIQGKPMVIQVMERALEADIGPVYVACCGPEIADIVQRFGGKAVITNPDLPSGTDRVYESLQHIDSKGKFDLIVNLQGDLPYISPRHIRAVVNPLQNKAVDMSTLAAQITHSEEITNPSVVKIALGNVDEKSENQPTARAIYFSRQAIPANADVFYHHIGIYAYQRASLERYVALPPSRLEMIEKLEQLRALEAGMRIDVVLVDGIPQSVDTQEDLMKVREERA